MNAKKFFPAMILVAALAITAVRAQTNKPPIPTKVEGEPTKTASGLQYWDIFVGKDEPAAAGDTVRVHYTGWLSTGPKFDRSFDRGTPFVFKLGAGQVIKGWDEGIAGMKATGKRQLRIPPELGYGEKGYSYLIPPNATLIFDVSLTDVTKPAAP